MEAEEPEAIKGDFWTWWPRNFPGAYGLDPLRDLQVITPMHRGAGGHPEPEPRTAAAPQPRKPALVLGGRVYRHGTR